MFSFSKTKNALVLSTSNQITNDKALTLDKELKDLNKLDSVQLKSKYLEVLTNNQRTENGGAGIGFVSILRKTKGKIDYKINPVNDKVSNFLFQSNLMNSKEGEVEQIQHFIAEDHYNFMNDNNFLLFRKGIFNHSTMLVMTDLLSVKLNLNTKSDQNKIIFFTIGELIQNIYNHGYKSEKGHEGIFIVRKEDGKLALSAGNFIENTNIKQISDLFDEINSLDADGVKTSLKERLLDFSGLSEDNFSSGIGLLEIKKLTNNKINYLISKINDKLSYLTVEIKNISE